MILIKYTKTILFTFALYCPSLLFGQIILTDINPDSLVASEYDLDLDNNGTPEFRIEAVVQGGINIVKALGISVNDSLAGSYAGYPNVVGYPNAMFSDLNIGDNNSWVDKGILGGDHSLIMEDAHWIVGPSRYLGLRFKIDSTIHYGWARLKMETSYVGFTVNDYAYNATPEEPIFSGATAVQEFNSSVSDINIFPNPCSDRTTISFSVQKETRLMLGIYNINGELIFSESEGRIMSGIHLVTLNSASWKEGIYFCRINTDDSFSTSKIIVAR